MRQESNHDKSTILEKSLNVVSLFSGAGGLDLGFAAAGFNIAVASDIDEYSCKTIEKNKISVRKRGNLPGLENTLVLQDDVRELDSTLLQHIAPEVVSDLDLLIGGPPCQSFSVFGKRGGRADHRGQLVFEFARILNELQPKVFVFENVYGLLTVEGGAVFDEIRSILANPGPESTYVVEWHRLNAEDFGVPQSRDRVIIIGRRSDVAKASSSPCVQDFAVDSLSKRTVLDAFRGLESPYSAIGKSIPNHRVRSHGSVVTERYKALAYGERDSKTRINKLDPYRPSFTIVVGSDAGGGKGHVHHIEPREVTPRESARIQTFPDWWVFQGNVRHMIRQVGNAVPPLLGFAIANAIRRDVFGLPSIDFGTGLGLLGQRHLFEESDSQQRLSIQSTEQLELTF